MLTIASAWWTGERSTPRPSGRAPSSNGASVRSPVEDDAAINAIVTELYERGGSDAVFNATYSWIVLALFPQVFEGELGDEDGTLLVELEPVSPDVELDKEILHNALALMLAVGNDDVEGARLLWGTLLDDEAIRVAGTVLGLAFSACPPSLAA